MEGNETTTQRINTWKLKSRQQKRNCIITLKGQKPMKAKDFLKSTAAHLDQMAPGQSHLHPLTSAYMEKGTDGIMDYIQKHNPLNI
jgi:hypothetical protein